jgi:predicted 3-demethylubiquinone-9 3-methyltransferase (glyoxalase superfamily)
MRKPLTLLLFEGRALEAMRTYVSIFPEAVIISLARYGKEGPGKEGTVRRARFLLNGQEFMAADSPVKHEFPFTPAVSIFVACESEREIDAAYARLAEGGEALMPLGDYGFSRKYGWLRDKFGVSWQLNLG